MLKAGDLVKSYLGNLALVLNVYQIYMAGKYETFVDIQWIHTGLVKECYQAATFHLYTGD
tara:strand:+ start:231 stop:410 length:180 start_codon:yes stop_codon:yes gene_type:complete